MEARGEDRKEFGVCTVYVEFPGCMTRSRIGEKATVSQGLTSKRNEGVGRQWVITPDARESKLVPSLPFSKLALVLDKEKK